MTIKKKTPIATVFDLRVSLTYSESGTHHRRRRGCLSNGDARYGAHAGRHGFLVRITRLVLFDSIARIHNKLALPVSLRLTHMLRRVLLRPVKLGGLVGPSHKIIRF